MGTGQNWVRSMNDSSKGTNSDLTDDTRRAPDGEEKQGPGPGASGDSRRLELVRSSLLFQLKLLADGLRDFFLVPISLVATLVGLARSAEDPEREFEQVLDLGRRTERWINLFGTHEPFEAAGEAGNIDQLVTRAERMVREQVREGNVTASAGEALEKTLAALHRRVDDLATSAGEGAGKDRAREP